MFNELLVGENSALRSMFRLEGGQELGERPQGGGAWPRSWRFAVGRIGIIGVTGVIGANTSATLGTCGAQLVSVACHVEDAARRQPAIEWVAADVCRSVPKRFKATDTIS